MSRLGGGEGRGGGDERSGFVDLRKAETAAVGTEVAARFQRAQTFESTVSPAVVPVKLLSGRLSRESACKHPPPPPPPKRGSGSMSQTNVVCGEASSQSDWLLA